MKSKAKPSGRGFYRRSRQRERILALLRSTESHPTAAWVYDRLKREFPRLSVGTVYRNVAILVEEGLVNRIDFGSTFDRFDANTAPHYHFICEECAQIIDVEVPFDHSITTRVDPTSGLEVHRHEIEFYGLCDACKKER